jgi:HPt (histidine-containing phosphotransfer) domain-containing protein
MAVPELQNMWVTETTDRLEQASAAFAAADLSEARRQVHAAAGSAGLCGAEALGQALTSIENLLVAGQGVEAGRAFDLALADFRLLAAALHRGPDR